MNLTEEITGAIEAPGATVTYDVHAGDSPDATPLFLIGSPMAAPGFVTLASHFTDRTVITYDPRGSERSQLTEPTSPPTPEQHADDLHQIIEELGSGAGRHVRQQRRRGERAGARRSAPRGRAHTRRSRAPTPGGPTRPRCRHRGRPRRSRDLHAFGWGAGMAHFIAVVSHQGEFPDDFAQQPAPDPQMFGMPADDDGSRTDPLLGLALVGSIGYEPDFEALRAASTRIVMAAGNERGHDGQPWRLRRGRSARHHGRCLSQRPRRLPRRRVRPDGRAGCFRGTSSVRSWRRANPRRRSADEIRIHRPSVLV